MAKPEELIGEQNQSYSKIVTILSWDILSTSAEEFQTWKS